MRLEWYCIPQFWWCHDNDMTCTHLQHYWPFVLRYHWLSLHLEHGSHPQWHLIKKIVHVYMNLISQMTLYIWKCRHFDTTDCTHNFWCNQYWKFHHNDDIFIAVYKVSISCAYHQTLLGFRYHLKVLMKVRQLMPCGPSSQMFPDPYCTSGINLLNNARWPQINSLLPVWKSCHFKHIHFKYMS